MLGIATIVKCAHRSFVYPFATSKVIEEKEPTLRTLYLQSFQLVSPSFYLPLVDYLNNVQKKKKKLRYHSRITLTNGINSP